MALSAAKIIDLGYETLRSYGLAAVSMRRLAGELDVQPGALYYHVASKQELLVAIAGRVLAADVVDEDCRVPTLACGQVRTALLSVRDGAELVSFVYAFRPQSLVALARLGELVAAPLAEPEASWAAQTLVRYVLGFVAEEQNHAELVKAGVLADGGAGGYTEQAFQFGVEAILRGVQAVTADGMVSDEELGV